MKKTIKDNAKSILKAAAIVVVAAALGTCQALTGIASKPAASFERVSMEGLSFDEANLKAYIKVQNDNAVSIPFPEINWKLSIAEADPGASFIHGAVPEGTKIDAGGSTTAELPFSISYLKLYDIIKKLHDSAEAPYRIDLDFRFSLPVLGSETFSTSFNGSIPLPKVPELSFSDINFDYGIFPPKAEFDLTLLVNNKNIFPINLDKLNYNFKVNNKIWVFGEAPKNTSLPARSPIEIPVTTSLDPLTAISEIIGIATTGSAVNYTCNGDISLSPQFANFTALEDHPFEFPGSTILKK